MDENKSAQTKNIFLNINIKDLFGFIIYLIVPLSFFFSNFISNYRIYYYAILAFFIAAYTLIGQFFFEDKKITNIGKKLISLTVINTLLISFVNLSGNISSPYYFILYFLLIFVGIFTSKEIVIFEAIIISFSIIITEIYKYSSLVLFFQSLETESFINLLSIPSSIPLVVIISAYISNLREKKDLLLLSKDLLTLKDIEDETLLQEVNQGIIIININLEIVKISKWIENNFNLASKFLLGKKLTELNFYDPVSNQKLVKTSQFYKNLQSSSPQKLIWKIYYKNQYDKFKNFLIKQTPLIYNNKLTGFIITVKQPPKSHYAQSSSFNKLLNNRISLNIQNINKLISNNDPKSKNLINRINTITLVLKDTEIRNKILSGNHQIVLSNTDLKSITKSVIEQLSTLGEVDIWDISPIYQNKTIDLETDILLCKKLLNSAIKGSFYLSTTSKISLTFDEDENFKKPSLKITTDVKTDPSINNDLIKPFFSSNENILSNYKGSGLEFSNANIISNYLGFDFNIKISNNKLVVKIIF